MGYWAVAPFQDLMSLKKGCLRGRRGRVQMYLSGGKKVLPGRGRGETGVVAYSPPPAPFSFSISLFGSEEVFWWWAKGAPLLVLPYPPSGARGSSWAKGERRVWEPILLPRLSHRPFAGREGSLLGRGGQTETESRV